MKCICWMLCLFTFSCFGSNIPPIWEDDPHFIYYRLLQVEGSLYDLRKTVIFIKKHKDEPESVLNLSEHAIKIAERALKTLGYDDYLQEDVEFNGL